jgi:hypothetical protein
MTLGKDIACQLAEQKDVKEVGPGFGRFVGRSGVEAVQYADRMALLCAHFCLPAGTRKTKKSLDRLLWLRSMVSTVMENGTGVSAFSLLCSRRVGRRWFS